METAFSAQLFITLGAAKNGIVARLGINYAGHFKIIAASFKYSLDFFF